MPSPNSYLPTPVSSIPFHQKLIRGAIGKKYVIKRYKGGKVVKTKYPNMKNIIASSSQKISRRTFRKAVNFVQAIYWNKEHREQ